MWYYVSDNYQYRFWPAYFLPILSGFESAVLGCLPCFHIFVSKSSFLFLFSPAFSKFYRLRCQVSFLNYVFTVIEKRFLFSFDGSLYIYSHQLLILVCIQDIGRRESEKQPRNFLFLLSLTFSLLFSLLALSLTFLLLFPISLNHLPRPYFVQFVCVDGVHRQV